MSATGDDHGLPLVHLEEVLVELGDLGVVPESLGETNLGAGRGGGTVHATGLEDELGLKRNLILLILALNSLVFFIAKSKKCIS